MNSKKRKEIFLRFQSQRSDPKTELYYYSAFELLIAVILSARTTDKQVNQVTKKLFNIANTPEKIYELGEDKLKQYIKQIGFYNTKAAYIIKTCKILINHYDSCVPKTRENLESLAGVGRKTANIILNTIFGQPTIGVDTHVFRVANRTKLAVGKTPLEVEKQLMKVIPKEFIKKAHHWLLLHGRYVCISRKPKCRECPIVDLCEYERKEK